MTNKWLRFFGFHFFVAVAGSILIVFGAPCLPRPAPVVRAIYLLDQNAVLRECSSALRGALSWRSPPGDRPSAVAASPAEEASPAAVSEAPPPAEESENREADMKAPEAEQASGVAPGTKRWGVVKVTEAKVYDKRGKFLSDVAAGTTLDISDLIKADAGMFALARVISPSNTFEEALVATHDIEIMAGALDAVREREKELRCAKARVMAELALRQGNGAKYLRKDNPMAEEFSCIRQRYVDYLKSARALKAKREAAQGAERMRIEDQLRVMKADDVRYGMTYKTAKQKFDDWNKAHPEPTGLEKDEIDALKEQMTRIQNDLDGLAAGPP